MQNGKVGTSSIIEMFPHPKSNSSTPPPKNRYHISAVDADKPAGPGDERGRRPTHSLRDHEGERGREGIGG